MLLTHVFCDMAECDQCQWRPPVMPVALSTSMTSVRKLHKATSVRLAVGLDKSHENLEGKRRKEQCKDSDITHFCVSWILWVVVFSEYPK